MSRKWPVKWFCLLVLVFAASACGYRFAGEGEGPRPGLQTIAIPAFENNTTESGLETTFAGDLRREFMLRSHFRVVPVEQAEATFYGRIMKIYTDAVAHLQVEQTILTRVYITLDIRCQDNKTKEILWQDNNFTYYKEYFQDPDPIVSSDNRRQAIDFIAREMTIRIHDRFLSNF